MRFLIVLTLLVFLAACSNSGQSDSSANSFQPSPRDTTKPIAAYIDRDGSAVVNTVFRVSFDTFRVVQNSDRVQKYRDSLYFIFTEITVVDSLGVPQKDSLGNPVRRQEYAPTLKENIVRDSDFRGFNVDSFLLAHKKKT